MRRIILGFVLAMLTSATLFARDTPPSKWNRPLDNLKYAVTNALCEHLGLCL